MRRLDHLRVRNEVAGSQNLVGAAFSLLALETGWMPGNVGSTRLDPACGPQIRLDAACADVRCVVSHSFGFGGTNCVLVFERGTS